MSGVPADTRTVCVKCGKSPTALRVEVVNIFRLRENEGRYVLDDADDAVYCGDCGGFLLHIAPEDFGIRLATQVQEGGQKSK